jgi:hypothetical protein
MEFIEAPLFTQLLPEYLSDDGYREVQLHLVRQPDAGDPIPGSGGFRKLRWGDRRRGKGKRGGLRIVYYYFIADSQIWFMTLYDKDEMVDLSPDEKRLLRAAIEQETRERARHRRARKG